MIARYDCDEVPKNHIISADFGSVGTNCKIDSVVIEIDTFELVINAARRFALNLNKNIIMFEIFNIYSQYIGIFLIKAIKFLGGSDVIFRIIGIITKDFVCL